MRQYNVVVRGESFLVLADSGNKARYEGVKLFRVRHPDRFSFAYLVAIASARLVSPKPSGRHPIMDCENL